MAAPWEDTTVIASVTPSRVEERGTRDAGSRWPWIVGVASVVVILAVVLAVVLSSGGTHHSAAPASSGAATSANPPASSASSAATAADGKQQATAIAGYLTQSAAARSGVSAAIGAIGTCTNIAGSVATLQNAAAVRDQIITDVAKAKVDGIQGGSAMVTQLRAALQASADADRHYAAWGTSSLAGCTGQAAHTADYTAAQQSDAAANTAKQSFVQSWNVIADRYGLAHEAVTSI
jgi:hypothetical protein